MTRILIELEDQEQIIWEAINNVKPNTQVKLGRNINAIVTCDGNFEKVLTTSATVNERGLIDFSSKKPYKIYGVNVGRFEIRIGGSIGPVQEQEVNRQIHIGYNGSLWVHLSDPTAVFVKHQTLNIKDFQPTGPDGDAKRFLENAQTLIEREIIDKYSDSYSSLLGQISDIGQQVKDKIHKTYKDFGLLVDDISLNLYSREMESLRDKDKLNDTKEQLETVMAISDILSSTHKPTKCNDCNSLINKDGYCPLCGKKHNGGK